MNVFKTWFGLPDEAASAEQPGFPWIYLHALSDIDAIDERRAKKLQMLFKHSTSCGLSGMMLRRFEQQWEGMGDQMDFCFLDVISHRELSREVARRYQVLHQSPQLLILNQGGLLRHASHGEIGGISLEDILKNPA
jgi:bacillithiol system protein YtxJ